MKKISKLGKTLIITVIVATFLTTCGIVVYAAMGDYFTQTHSKSGGQNLTRYDWNDILDKLNTSSSNGGMYVNPYNCSSSNACCEYNGDDSGIHCTYSD